LRILVTGSAGFIGFHLARRLLADGHQLVGVDGMTPYYDVRLKRARRELLRAEPGFADHELMLEDSPRLAEVVAAAAPEAIVHLAAQAGVRYSLENPRAYVDANLVGSFNLLEAAKAAGVRHLLLASTSSVYGGNEQLPFSERDKADWPLTLYAATKKASEAMSHAYSHLWRIPTTAVRFFTVYGPWGRPDMALFKFVRAMLADEPIELFNGGEMERDFTYVDDLVEAMVRLLARPPVAGEPIGPLDTLSPVAPWRVVNIAGDHPTPLLDYVAAAEAALGRKARRKLLPMQPGDAPRTRSDAALLMALTGYRPSTPVTEGVKAFCDWYRDHYASDPA
jgi:UDP-glucuronate 4-epimerase